MNIFRKFRAYLQLREAVHQADKAHAETGERYYVLPSMDGKLVIMNRINFRKLKQKSYIDHKIKIADLVAESFYFTPYANGGSYITKDFLKRKAKSYYSWIEANHKIKRTTKLQKESNETGKKIRSIPG